MTDIHSIVARAIAQERWNTAQDAFDGKSENALVYSERLAKAAIAAHEKALKDEGLVIVPREPTTVMRLVGGYLADRELGFEGMNGSHIIEVWRAMVDAVPGGRNETDAALEGKE